MDLSYDRRLTAGETPNEDDFGELQVAEYVVFLLALDTYLRYVQQAEKDGDEVQGHGLSLLRRADTLHGEAIATFFSANLSQDAYKRMLVRAMALRPTAEGAARRALMVRTILSKGGTATMRAVFDVPKARKFVQDAIEATLTADPDTALDKFAAIPLRNPRIRDWIDLAAKTAGPGTAQDAVAVVSKSSGVAGDTEKLLAARLKEEASDSVSEERGEATQAQERLITEVRDEAAATARRTMERSGEEDTPPKKSEVIGIAAAAAVAALADPDRTQNIPTSLQSLDPEQQAAALTDGRVLVPAGAGSGKTTTLAARLAYLVRDKKVSPNRVFVVSFNTGAAGEIKERVAAHIGQESMDQMSAGTMHSIFKRFVVEYGTSEEKEALTTWLMTPPRKRTSGPQPPPGKAPSPAAFGGYMARIWKECNKGEDPPRGVGNVIQGWVMNDITPVKAKAQAATPEEVNQAEWYRWVQGFKGIDKTFAPPCIGSNPKAQRMWGEFLSKWRNNGRARLGDFSDMILMFRDVLLRNESVRKKVQSMFDHICVDEAQDLNQVQHQIIAMMGEHVGDGSDGKSVWLVGDEVQSINRFVGARPELFAQFYGKEGWKVRKIATNYRCLPEIIEAANRLMTKHPRGIPMEARPDAKKPRGKASVVVQTPGSHAQGAIGVVQQIHQDVEAGAPLSNYAVLSRTNMELNDYETACIVSGIPYARRGGTSFLRSPETVAVMSYVNLVVGSNFERMQRSLAEVLNKPNRFFLQAGRSEEIVAAVVRKRARRLGISETQVNPLDLFDDEGMGDFLDEFDPRRQWESWRVKGTREQLENLAQALLGMREQVEAGTTVDRSGKTVKYTTQSLIGDILNIKGVSEARGKEPPTLRDVLMPFRGGQEEEADAPSDGSDDPSKKPIGNVEFLYQIAQPTGDPETDPSDPFKFKARIDQLVVASKDLRVDLDEWNTEQRALPPEQRSKPPCVVLSTVHSVKGAQWTNTTAVMAQGVFPFEVKSKVDESSLTPAQQAALAERREKEFLTERQLAYVAMTRAAESLTIVCPAVNAYGRPSGMSSFVAEAGLRPGQNVAGKNDPTPEVPPVATVLAYVPRFGAQEDFRDEAFSYDRRN